MNTYIRENGKVRYFKNEKEASAFLNGKKPSGGKKPAESKKPSGGKKPAESKKPSDGENNNQQDNE